ncbi:MAG: peroxiredoxin [Bacillota bacterium]|nr:peroxiredoxin [Bacillota bacterium]
MIEIGQPAPDFRLPATRVGEVSLSDFRGRNVYLIFYPKDNTPGCRRQLSAARDAIQAYEERGTAVLAVNPGSLNSHEKWSEKEGFPFPIAVDADRSVAAAYDALKENGTSIQRTVYLIDRDGVVRYAKRGMPSTEELLAEIDAINAGSRTTGS